MGSVDLQKEGWQLDLFCILIVMKNLLTLIYFFYLIYIFCVITTGKHHQVCSIVFSRISKSQAK